MKNRRTLKIEQEDLIRLKKLQGNILAQTGKEVSLPELIGRITKSPSFDDIEQQIMKNPQLNFRIRFD